MAGEFQRLAEQLDAMAEELAELAYERLKENIDAGGTELPVDERRLQRARRAVLKAADRAVEAVDPALPIVAGSLVGSDGTFLRALYAEGIEGHYDGLAVHYYDLTLASLRAIREAQRKAGDTTPLWLTEFGWTSCFPARKTEGQHACVTAKQQARNLGDVFRALRGKRWVRAAIVYKLRKVLHSLDSQAALDLLLDKLRESKTNIEFLMQIAKTTPGE